MGPIQIESEKGDKIAICLRARLILCKLPNMFGFFACNRIYKGRNPSYIIAI